MKPSQFFERFRKDPLEAIGGDPSLLRAREAGSFDVSRAQELGAQIRHANIITVEEVVSTDEAPVVFQEEAPAELEPEPAQVDYIDLREIADHPVLVVNHLQEL